MRAHLLSTSILDATRQEVFTCQTADRGREAGQGDNRENSFAGFSSHLQVIKTLEDKTPLGLAQIKDKRV